MNLHYKTAALLTAIALLLPLTSCTMRETYDRNPAESSLTDDGDAGLKVAEKVNSVEIGTTDGTPTGLDSTAPDGTTGEEKTVTVALAGDIKLSAAMINDAHAQAAEGKEYSFLRMYTGAYRALNDTDISVGMYSSVGQPYGTEADYEPPTEHIDALSALGFDVLDISGMGSDYTRLNERDIDGISSDEESSSAVRTVEVGQMKLSFVSCGCDDTLAQCCYSDDFIKLLEDSDGGCDSLIVLVHWDKDMAAEEKREAVMPLIEAGADVIVGDGETIETIELVTTGSDEDENAKEALVCYSLGNLLSDANEAVNLVSGILTLTYTEDGAALPDEAVAVPTFVHYEVNESGTRANYAIYRAVDYTAELAHLHPAEVDPDGLKNYINSVIPSDYLPEEYR